MILLILWSMSLSLREVVPQLSEQDAIAIMLEAHNTGVGLVIILI